MNIHPNQTVVKARVKKVAPCADGYGHELDLEVLENESDPSSDFLRPQAGAHLTVFTANLGSLSGGSEVRATLALAGGPAQERILLRKAEPLSIKP